MITGFGNNTSSILSADITATQTTLSLVPGGGEAFAKLLTTDISNSGVAHGIFAKITLTDSQQTVFEICHLISVAGDVLSVVRGQEGTSAKGWALNDMVANFATRGSEQSFVQIEQLQAGDFTSAIAGGTANALTISLPSTFLNNGSSDWALNTPLTVTPAETNTGNVTVQVTLAGSVIGTYPIKKGNGAELRAGDIVKDSPIVIVLSKKSGNFSIANPATGITDPGLFLEKDNNLSEIAEAGAEAQAEARGNLGCGTAAVADAQVSTKDVTPGRLMQVGAFGLGVTDSLVVTDADLINKDGFPTAFITQGGGADDQHFGVFGAGAHISYGVDANTAHSANVYIGSDGNIQVEWLQVDRATGEASSRKQKLYGPLNLPPQQDLSGYVVGDGVKTLGFASHDAGQPYMRHEETDAIINLATTDWVRAFFVQDARMSGAIWLSHEGTVAGDPGTVVFEGGDFGSDDGGYGFTYLQKLIGSTWYNFEHV